MSLMLPSYSAIVMTKFTPSVLLLGGILTSLFFVSLRADPNQYHWNIDNYWPEESMIQHDLDTINYGELPEYQENTPQFQESFPEFSNEDLIQDRDILGVLEGNQGNLPGSLGNNTPPKTGFSIPSYGGNNEFVPISPNPSFLKNSGASSSSGPSTFEESNAFGIESSRADMSFPQGYSTASDHSTYYSGEEVPFDFDSIDIDSIKFDLFDADLFPPNTSHPQQYPSQDAELGHGAYTEESLQFGSTYGGASSSHIPFRPVNAEQAVHSRYEGDELLPDLTSIYSTRNEESSRYAMQRLGSEPNLNVQTVINQYDNTQLLREEARSSNTNIPGCSVDITTLPENHALIGLPDGPGVLLYPNNGNKIQIADNKEIHVTCPKSNLKYVTMNNDYGAYNPVSINVKCEESNLKFDQNEFNNSHFECENLPAPSVHMMTSKWSQICNRSAHFRITFDFGLQSILAYEVCVNRSDHRNPQTFYVFKRLDRTLRVREQNSLKEIFYRGGRFFFNRDRYYRKYFDWQSIKKSLVEQVGKEQFEELVQYSEQTYHLKIGYLLDKGAFVYRAEQQTALYYANAQPIWTNLERNWRVVEDSIISLAVHSPTPLVMFSGTLGNLEHNGQNGKVKLYLALHENVPQFPVPEIFWKIIVTEPGDKCVTIIGHNTSKNVFLKDIACNFLPVKWLKGLMPGKHNGVVYTCECKSFFEKSFGKEIWYVLPPLKNVNNMQLLNIDLDDKKSDQDIDLEPEQLDQTIDSDTHWLYQNVDFETEQLDQNVDFETNLIDESDKEWLDENIDFGTEQVDQNDAGHIGANVDLDSYMLDHFDFDTDPTDSNVDVNNNHLSG